MVFCRTKRNLLDDTTEAILIKLLPAIPLNPQPSAASPSLETVQLYSIYARILAHKGQLDAAEKVLQNLTIPANWCKKIDHLDGVVQARIEIAAQYAQRHQVSEARTQFAALSKLIESQKSIPNKEQIVSGLSQRSVWCFGWIGKPLGLLALIRQIMFRNFITPTPLRLDNRWLSRFVYLGSYAVDTNTQCFKRHVCICVPDML